MEPSLVDWLAEETADLLAGEMVAKSVARMAVVLDLMSAGTKVSQSVEQWVA